MYNFVQICSSSSKLTTLQWEKLLQFARKHSIQQLFLNKDECELFFKGIDKANKIDKGRILLSSGLAEGSWKIDTSWSNSTRRVFIPQHMLFTVSKEDKSQFLDDDFTLFTEKILQRFLNTLGLEVLIQKIADELHKMHVISIGQAGAVIRKTLGYKLNSGQRSFLHDLRIKIGKYKTLVDNFEIYVVKKADKQLEEISLKEELLQKTKSREFIDLEKIETSFGFANKLYLKCFECDHIQELPNEVLESNDFIPLPTHHEKQMVIKMSDEKLIKY